MKESVAADALHVAWETEGTVTGRSAEKTRGGGLGVALVSCRGPGRCGGRRHPPVRGAAVQVRPQRNERRHVIVDAFDNEAEFLALLESIQADIQRRTAAGDPVDRNEHASGTVYEPGHHRRAATGHLVRRMMEHGVDPAPGSTLGTCLPTSRSSASTSKAALVLGRWAVLADSFDVGCAGPAGLDVPRRQGGGPAHHTVTSPVSRPCAAT